ncbi:MAG TPA: pyruvate, water dikinase regulatory protein [Alphaproteobacteria bacterium]|nr:pyruvate, water dikinase regulatory protein [Alphaproteobacteria bacterium]
MNDKHFHIHLVSDATGETINAIARACLAQFDHIEAREHFWSLIRTRRQLDLVFEGIRQWPGLVLYTFVDEELRRAVQDFCRDNNIAGIPVLDPILGAMAAMFGAESAHAPGRQHALDADYFARIDAMDYAIAADDGHGAGQLANADVIILGVSRTSKTPTCVYLANRGIKAANIPIIPGHPAPDMSLYPKPLLVGLTNDADNLVEIRKSRLKLLRHDAASAYTDPAAVGEELREARRLFARLGCPVIDVTRRSIEETAAEIMMLLNRREAAPMKGAGT